LAISEDQNQFTIQIGARETGGRFIENKAFSMSVKAYLEIFVYLAKVSDSGKFGENFQIVLI
jgi:hypothetical protein